MEFLPQAGLQEYRECLIEIKGYGYEDVPPRLNMRIELFQALQVQLAKNEDILHPN